MRNTILLLLASTVSLAATGQGQPDWAAVEAETLRHFQAIVRLDSADPPGGEKPVADYVTEVLQLEGIPVQTFALEANRPNIVARLKGNGRRRPLLLMAHTDTVNVDAKKWTFPPFSAERSGGHIYGRGTVDDKDNVVSALMTMLLLKRLNVPLGRDVIFLAEAGEEGSARVGIQFMVNQHYDAIDAEYCFAEGAFTTRENGRVKVGQIQTMEKIPRAIKLTAKGTAGHGSWPLVDNPIVRLGRALAAVGAWTPPTRLNETSVTYFQRLAAISTPEEAERYRNAISSDPELSEPAQDYLREHESRHWSMLRTSLSPTIVQGGYRSNVIPSEATAHLDVRQTQDEDPEAFLELVRQVVNDPNVEVAYANPASAARPPTPTGRLDAEAFRVLEAALTRHYGVVALPTMGTGATDMAYLRQKGMLCYGMGPALDAEDVPKGFGPHGDQERILESELHRFVRFQFDAALELARAR